MIRSRKSDTPPRRGLLSNPPRRLALAGLLCIAGSAGGAGPRVGWSGPIDAAGLTGYLAIGPLYLDATVAGRTARFRNDGSGRYTAISGRGALRETGVGNYEWVMRDGTRWAFEPSAATEQAMIESQRGGTPQLARVTLGVWHNGETWRWEYETRSRQDKCGPVGRFGLTNPDCRSTTWERPKVVRSSRRLALVARYRGDRPGPDFGRLRAIDLYATPGCGIAQDWEACQGRARLIRRIASTGMVGPRP